jgi:hypothetical protein
MLKKLGFDPEEEIGVPDNSDFEEAYADMVREMASGGHIHDTNLLHDTVKNILNG